MDKREFLLVTFPLLQSASFAASCLLLDTSPVLAAVFLLVASLCLSFALHITYHYHVHFKRHSESVNRLIDFAITAFLGLPFHYYQLLHWNHHKHDNALGDFTSTWTQVAGRPVAKNLFSYALLWPLRRDVRIREQLRIASRDGYFKASHRLPLALESAFVLAIYATLAYSNVRLAVAYLSMVYLGWSFIALHNYGQHLPEVYGDSEGNSYYGSLYNLLTVYNGLHNEHHQRPSVKYWDLTAPAPRSEIGSPHLVEGLHFAWRRRSSAPRRTA
jgi:fatty acid desaturase